MVTIVALIVSVVALVWFYESMLRTQRERLDTLREKHQDFTKKYRDLFEKLMSDIQAASKDEAAVRVDEASAVIGRIATGDAIHAAQIMQRPKSVAEIEEQIQRYSEYAGYQIGAPDKVAEAIIKVIPDSLLRDGKGPNNAN